VGEGIIDIHSPVAVLAAGGEITDVNVKETRSSTPEQALRARKNAPDAASYQTALSDRRR
jgi:hypothetical protein